jgi:hypothetical protein
MQCIMAVRMQTSTVQQYNAAQHSEACPSTVYAWSHNAAAGTDWYTWLYEGRVMLKDAADSGVFVICTY